MRRIHSHTIVITLAILFSVPGLAAEPIRVADGESLASSLKQLEQRRVNGDASPVVMELDAKEWVLDATLAITPTVVGDGLTIRPATGLDRATITSAVRLNESGSDETWWRFDLPESLDSQARLRQLIVDTRLSTSARHPNLGTLRIEASLPDRRSGFVTSTDSLPTDFEGQSLHADLIFLHDWSSSRVPVASYDAETRELRTLGPIGCSAPHYAIDHFEKQPRYWLEGSSSFADQPGEWWHDVGNQQIVMRRGDPESPAPVVALPTLETLFRASGDDRQPIRGLRLERITFRGSRFPMPVGGLAGAQATMHEPRDGEGNRIGSNRPMLSAAVVVERAEGVEFRDCKFESLGNSGLWLASRTSRCLVQGCAFRDIGGNGINLGENSDRRVDGKTWHAAAPNEVPIANRVTECSLQECGRILFGSVGIWASFQQQLLIDQNRIENLPYTGISIGWTWSDTPTPAGNNVIRENTIMHPMQLLSDGGGIYTLGRQEGSLIEENTIIGIPNAAGRAESNGMFLDEGTTGFTIRRNTIRWVAQSPLRFHKAGKNLVTENQWELFRESTPHVRYNNTPESNISLHQNSVLQRPSRTMLIGNSLTWDTLPSKLDGEVYWHVDCGKPLPYIRRHPEKPCVASSTLWPRALRLGPYDHLVVQPHYGSTLDEDIATIEAWLMDQPHATLVIHTGWARHESLRQELADAGSAKMVHNADYFAKLVDVISQRRPELEIVSTDMYRLLAQIDADIQSQGAPFQNISELYRDAIHLSHEIGRPLAHAMMRKTLGQPSQFEPAKTVDATKAKYLEQQLSVFKANASGATEGD